MYPAFSEKDLVQICDQLARKDKDIRSILKEHGYPPFWSRKAGFETLIHIILEQQVSLASARAALLKLKAKLGRVTPAGLLALTDEELKACYFSRQKTVYARCLAESIQNRKLSISALKGMSDENIREQLCRVKGIGNWTVDVFLMMVLHRHDLFPAGDIALLNSVRHIKQSPDATAEEILSMAENWRPYRTVAAFMFWHAYIKRKNIVF